MLCHHVWAGSMWVTVSIVVLISWLLVGGGCGAEAAEKEHRCLTAPYVPLNPASSHRQEKYIVFFLGDRIVCGGRTGLTVRSVDCVESAVERVCLLSRLGWCCPQIGDIIELLVYTIRTTVKGKSVYKYIRLTLEIQTIE